MNKTTTKKELTSNGIKALTKKMIEEVEEKKYDGYSGTDYAIVANINNRKKAHREIVALLAEHNFIVRQDFYERYGDDKYDLQQVKRNVCRKDSKKEIEKLFKETKEDKDKKDAQKRRKQNKDKKLKDVSKDIATVVRCAFIVNKEAKRHRDICENMKRGGLILLEGYDGDEYYKWVCTRKRKKFENSKREKENLYDIKDKALDKIVKEKHGKIIGYHTFADGTARDMIESYGYTFHINKNTSKKNLGDIGEDIAALSDEEQKAQGISAKDAVVILEHYIAK